MTELSPSFRECLSGNTPGLCSIGWNQAQNPSAFKPGGYHKTAGCVKPSLEEQVMVAMRQGDWARFVTEYRMDQVVSRNHLSDECRSPSTGRYLRKTKPLEN